MKTYSENPFVYLVKKFWHYSKGNHKNVITYISFSTIANVISALDPLVIGFFLNVIQTQGVHQGNIWTLLGVLGIFVLKEAIFWLFHGSSRYLEMLNAFFMRNNYKNHLLKGVMDLPIEWHTNHHSGDTIDKIEKGTSALYSFAESGFQFISAFIFLGVSFVALFYFDVITGFVVVVLTMVTLYVLYIFDKKLVPGYVAVNKMENVTSAKVFDILSNVTTVIILRIEKLVLGSIDSYLQKPRDQIKSNSKTQELKWFSASILGRLIVVIVIGIYVVVHLSKGVVLVGTIYILYGYANQIRETFFTFAYLYNDTVRRRASVANAEEISKEFKESTWSENKHLPKDWKQLAIKNLSFSYHSRKDADLHLDDVSLVLKKGERVAVIGESGGGKSTFLKLIRDLYHPKKLNLFVDGKKLMGGFEEISDSISLVPQDPEIFATTIRENITLGVEYTRKHLKKVTDIACFTDVVGRLPKKMESSIVEKGVNLSGGEKQRLALSRGVLASEDKDIVLLDEPTSSVDMKNELAIYQNIFNAFPDKTIISSIHRLHLLALFDVIYFFKNGKIIASGSLDDLKLNSSDFQELWDKYLQSHEIRDSVT